MQGCVVGWLLNLSFPSLDNYGCKEGVLLGRTVLCGGSLTRPSSFPSLHNYGCEEGVLLGRAVLWVGSLTGLSPHSYGCEEGVLL